MFMLKLIGVSCLSVVHLQLDLTLDELEEQEESASKHGRNSRLQCHRREFKEFSGRVLR